MMSGADLRQWFATTATKVIAANPESPLLLEILRDAHAGCIDQANGILLSNVIDAVENLLSQQMVYRAAAIRAVLAAWAISAGRYCCKPAEGAEGEPRGQGGASDELLDSMAGQESPDEFRRSLEGQGGSEREQWGTL